MDPVSYIGGEYASNEIEKFSLSGSDPAITTFFPETLNSNFRHFFETGSDSLSAILEEIYFNFKKAIVLYTPINFCNEALERVELKLKNKGISILLKKIENFNSIITDDNHITVLLALHFNCYSEKSDSELLDLRKKKNLIIIEDFVQAPFCIEKMSADYGFNSLRKIANIEISVAYLKNKSAENTNEKSSEYYLLKKEACELKALFFKNRDEKIETKYLRLYKEAEKKLYNKIIQNAIKSEVTRLNSTDLKSLLLKRKKNHESLYALLSGNKNLKLISGDYMYLMFTLEDRDELKKHLANHHIFTAIHWLDSHSTISEKILALPVDQRYDLNDMKKIAKTVNLFYK